MNYNPLLTSLIEIFDGCSRFDLNGRTLFFKHFNLKDQNLISLNFNKYKNIAIKKGIETQEQILNRIKEDGTWLPEDDLKINELELYIENLKKSKKHIHLPSKKEAHQKLIDEEYQKLNILLSKKKELINISAEDYANRRANEEFLRMLIYEDESFKKLKFTEDEFGELTSLDISNLNESYMNFSDKLNDDKIQEIVLQDFFNMYLSCCEDPHAFFGKFIYEMSCFQIKLLLYARIFNNIFQYNDDIPDEIRKDPKEIFKFTDMKKAKDKYQQDNKDSDATMLFGATSKDLEILDPSAKKISLSEQIAKNGGSLNMEDMMKLMGN